MTRLITYYWKQIYIMKRRVDSPIDSHNESIRSDSTRVYLVESIG